MVDPSGSAPGFTREQVDDSNLHPNLMSHVVEFSAALFRVEGEGGWTFAPVPEALAPSVAGPWGRTSVEATVDGRTWKTSVWRERTGRTLLAVPRAVRQGKEHGDVVQVRLRYGHF